MFSLAAAEVTAHSAYELNLVGPITQAGNGKNAHHATGYFNVRK
jgi:hypothetical protein